MSLRFERSSVSMRPCAGDFLSVKCAPWNLEAQSCPFCSCLLRLGPPGMEGFTFHPNTQGLAFSVLIGKWLGPAFCEGPGSLCFCSLPLGPSWPSATHLALPTQGEWGSGYLIFPSWADYPSLLFP